MRPFESRLDLYEYLAANKTAILAEAEKIGAGLGIPAELKGKLGTSGANSSLPGDYAATSCRHRARCAAGRAEQHLGDDIVASLNRCTATTMTRHRPTAARQRSGSLRRAVDAAAYGPRRAISSALDRTDRAACRTPSELRAPFPAEIQGSVCRSRRHCRRLGLAGGAIRTPTS